jgi:hypothetical protein
LTTLKNIAKLLPFPSLILAIFFAFGCRVSESHGEADEPVPGIRNVAPITSIGLSSSDFEKDAASYKWKVNSAPISDVEFGSSKLEPAVGEPIQTIELDLKQLPAGDQTLASIIIETKGKYGSTFATTTSNIGTDKGQDIRKMVTPIEDLGAVHDGTVLAKGVGAFPSLVVHLSPTKGG